MASDACHSQASKPPGSTPTGMSATRKSGTDAAASCRSKHHWIQAWKATRSACSCAARATAGPKGSRNSSGQRCQPAPRRSVRTTKTAQRSSAAPRSARQASNVARSVPAAQIRSSASILSAATRRAVDPTLGIQGAAGRRQLGELVADALGAGNLLDPQVQRAPETSGARVVGAGLRLRSRVRRTERPDGQEACPCRCRPRTELPQVGQVADSPAAPRARGCQLNRPAPRPQTGRQVAAAGAGDDQLLAAVVAREPVIAVWRVDGHRVDAAQAGAVLEDELARHRQASAAPDHRDGVGIRLVRSHRGDHRGEDIGSDRPRRAVRVDVRVQHQRAAHAMRSMIATGNSARSSASGTVAWRSAPSRFRHRPGGSARLVSDQPSRSTRRTRRGTTVMTSPPRSKANTASAWVPAAGIGR